VAELPPACCSIVEQGAFSVSTTDIIDPPRCCNLISSSINPTYILLFLEDKFPSDPSIHPPWYVKKFTAYRQDHDVVGMLCTLIHPSQYTPRGASSFRWSSHIRRRISQSLTSTLKQSTLDPHFQFLLAFRVVRHLSKNSNYLATINIKIRGTLKKLSHDDANRTILFDAIPNAFRFSSSNMCQSPNRTHSSVRPKCRNYINLVSTCRAV
jgi:hypothetical protein